MFFYKTTDLTNLTKNMEPCKEPYHSPKIINFAAMFRKKISTADQMEEAALHCGILPFFANPITGFSVEEMAAPGCLFGGPDAEQGCWEWKGPVILRQTTAYGKFFRRKAGFVALPLLPDFINYRRAAYPIKAGSTEEMLFNIINSREGVTSTDLRRIIFGTAAGKRHALDSPLTYLQMGAHLLIADFEYKYTNTGRRYGWGTSLYSTPEIWFEQDFSTTCSPEKSFRNIVSAVAKNIPNGSQNAVAKLLK